MRKHVFLWVGMVAFQTNAQKFEPKAVTVADLQQQVHPLDKTSSAAILYKVGDCNISFLGNGFQTKYQVKMRLKIYDKKGYEWATQSVYFSSGGRGASVDFDDVITYNLVDGKIVKTPITKDGIFEEKVTKYRSQKKLQFPNVKEGSILEMTYTINMMGLGTPPKWTFQSKIPVDYAEFNTHIPEYLIYNTSQKGFVFPKVTKKQVQRSGGYEETVTTYKAENMPAMKDEAFVTNIDNYTSGIGHELSAVQLPMRYAGYYTEKVASDWNTIAQRLYEHEDFGGEVKKNGYYEKQVDSIVKGLTGRNEIISAVFGFVQSKVKWNNHYGLACENGVKRAFKEKTGNVADINLMLTAMLRHLEIEASPVLVSTRNNGIVYFPSIDNFDYLIVGVQTPTGYVLLDATGEFSLPDLLPMRDLNWFGRLIRENGTSEQIDLIPTALSKENTFLTATVQADGVVSGKIKKQYTDYTALDFREKNKDIAQETFLESLEAALDNAIVDNYQRENEKDPSKVLTETYSFKDSHTSELINDKLYISPLLFLRMKDNPFKQEKREYPIDFGFPTQKRINATIQIPEGYAIESMPENMSLETENGVGTFKFILVNQGSSIQLTAVVEVKAALVSAEHYTLFKAFYQQMVEKQNEKIILAKK